MSRSVFGAILLAAVAAGSNAPAAAQDAAAVSDAAGVLAAAWRAGDVEALVPFLPDEGIDLSLEGVDHRGVNRRQARAALARFFEDRPGGEVAVRRAEALGGDPPRGLVELIWTVRTAGTSETRSFVIFVSLTRILDDWSIEEIRVFS